MMAGYLLSIVLFGEGLLTGLTLTVMVGPVTMIILRYGIQMNRNAGVWAASGTWFSDLIFIAGTFWATASIAEWIQRPSIRQGIYIAGGCGLMVIGLMMARTKRQGLNLVEEHSARNYARAFLGGFLVNSLSPATLFFWAGAALFLHLQNDHPAWYYLGVMLSLAMGDFIKAWMAPKLTQWISDKYIYRVQVIAGILIALTGIYMIGIGLWDG